MEQEEILEQQEKKQNKVITYLKELSRKDKITLAGTIIIITVVLALKFAILPQMEKYSDNLMRLEQVRSELIRVKAFPKENQLLEEKAGELELQYEASLVQLPKTPEVAQVAYDIRYFVKNSNVELFSLGFSEADVSEEAIKPKSEVIVEGAAEITTETSAEGVPTEHAVKKQIVSISVSGLHKEIMSFIKAIEGYSRISDVSNISLSKGEDKKLNASITANFYHLNYEEQENYDFNDGKYGKEDAFN